MRRFAATLFVALAAAAVPGAAWAETDIVLDNESSDTEVHTGESSFTNDSNVNTGSGVSDETAENLNSASAPAVQGFAANASEPIAAVADASEPASKPAGQTSGTNSSSQPELLFVGLPVSTSIAP